MYWMSCKGLSCVQVSNNWNRALTGPSCKCMFCGLRVPNADLCLFVKCILRPVSLTCHSQSKLHWSNLRYLLFFGCIVNLPKKRFLLQFLFENKEKFLQFKRLKGKACFEGRRMVWFEDNKSGDYNWCHVQIDALLLYPF